MSEHTLQVIASLKIVWVALGSLLYGLGGISNKWIRRFILPLWMGLGLWVFGMWQSSFTLWCLGYPLLLCASLHMGYGGTDDVWFKIRKRSIYGLCIAISALPIVLISHLWLLFGFHCALCVSSSVFLGVSNPTTSARDEESLIAALSTVLVLFLI
jgi:hypothetical protein